MNFCQPLIVAIRRQAAQGACLMGCLVGCLMVAEPSILTAEPIRFASAEATYHSGNEDEFACVVDGVETGPEGWSVAGRVAVTQSLVVSCVRPVEAAELDISLFFLAGKPFNPMAEFTLSFTTDAKPSLQGNWRPLDILRFNSQATTLARISSSGLRAARIPYNVNGGVPDEIYRLTVVLPDGRATGFRLDAHPVAITPTGQLVGLSWYAPHDFTLTEFRVAVHQRETTNIALYQPARSSHPLYLNPDRTRLRAEMLTDGLPATIAHPGALPPDSGFFYEVDLGRICKLDHIGLRTRGDEQFERFSRVKLSLFTHEPDSAAATWQGMVRADGSHPPPGVVEILRPGDGEGEFQARYLRISSDSMVPYSPQLAEVEVYETRSPEVVTALADGREIPVGEPLVIPPGTKHLSLRLEIPGLGLPPGDWFRWRVRNDIDDWNTSRLWTLNMACPPPGQSVFEAQALHSDNQWDATVFRLPIVVRQHLWENRIVQAVGVAAAIMAAVFLSGRAMQRRTARELAAANARAALAEERSRIARDLHDDLGANLAEIAMISELARESLPGEHPARAPLNRIFDRAEGNARRLGEIVWSINPSNDTLEHFTKYLCKFTQDYLAAANIRCRFQLPEMMQQGSFTAIQRYHLLLAAKEAIHNAVRHGMPSTITLRLGVEGDRFVVEIRDDGAGCNSEVAISSPRGCGNMRLRMETIGGNFEFISSPGKGSTVILSTPFP